MGNSFVIGAQGKPIARQKGQVDMPGMIDEDFDRDSDGAACNVESKYICHRCGHEWSAWWSCACDDECPECGATVEATDFETYGLDEQGCAA